MQPLKIYPRRATNLAPAAPQSHPPQRFPDGSWEQIIYNHSKTQGERPFYLAQMFPIKSLQKPLVTGALFFLRKPKVIIFMHTEPLGRTPGLDADAVREEQRGAGRRRSPGRRGARRGSVFGLLLNACPGSFVVGDFLLPRSPKQAGAFVVNLQNLPETEHCPHAELRVCHGEWTFVVSFLDIE